jgi:hypothetical protein
LNQNAVAHIEALDGPTYVGIKEGQFGPAIPLGTLLDDFQTPQHNSCQDEVALL